MTNEFKRKWENYWYHYKARTWIVIMVILALGYTVFEYASTEKYDMSITYIGKFADYEGIAESLESDFGDIIKDIDKNGKKSVGVANILASSEHFEGDMLFWQRIDINFVNGESYLYFIDKSIYPYLKQRNALGKIETKNGNVLYIDVTEDERFSKFAAKDEPLYLCVRNDIQLGKNSKNEKMEENGRKILEKILEKY